MPSASRARRLLAALLAAAVSPLAVAALPAAAAGGEPSPPVSSTPVAATVDPALLSAAGGQVRVVVRLHRDAADRSAAARREVRRLGGRLTRELPLVDGFAATLPARGVAALAAAQGVAVLSADRPVELQSGSWDSDTAPLAPRVLQAPKAWSAGTTGRDVTVALLDTGVADVPDLTGRVVPVQDERTGRSAACYDLSGEGNCADSFGHGTFMAGLVAGNGAAGGGAPIGTAPGARVLSVKVAGADGAADVSTVLAGLQWVVSFRDAYDIGVVNLSLGTDSTQSWEHDPLNYAVERAWEAGIVVVVAAANTGPGPGTIAKPADDPWVITVGAVDTNGTPGVGDDRVPDFSSRGPTRHGVAKPDVVAPGARVLSLRAVGSTIDRSAPPADLASPYRTGSGTSMAAALVSGVAALTRQAHPTMTPDQVKHALLAGARPAASDDRHVVGAGLADAARTVLTPTAGAANRGLARSTGRGDLASTRGSLSLALDDPLTTALDGRQTAQLLLWDPVGYSTGSWTPSTWYTSAHATAGWNTAQWSGSTDLSGNNWTGNNWTGNNWTGNNWTGNNWTGNNWTGSSWYDEHEDRTHYGRHGPGSASYGAW